MRAFSTVLAVVLFCAVTSELARADEWAGKGRVTFVNTGWRCVVVEIRQGDRIPAAANPLVRRTTLRHGETVTVPNRGESVHVRSTGCPLGGWGVYATYPIHQRHRDYTFRL